MSSKQQSNRRTLRGIDSSTCGYDGGDDPHRKSLESQRFAPSARRSLAPITAEVGMGINEQPMPFAEAPSQRKR